MTMFYILIAFSRSCWSGLIEYYTQKEVMKVAIFHELINKDLFSARQKSTFAQKIG
jgi:hypothetical protein